jgi:hypothetical protein
MNIEAAIQLNNVSNAVQIGVAFVDQNQMVHPKIGANLPLTNKRTMKKIGTI